LRFGFALGLVLLVATSGCGGGSSTPESVVRAWSAALGAEDNERAGSLFAEDAVVIQGSTATTFHTHADAVRWNSRLPCAGRIVALTHRGSTATATFRLGDRKSGPCGAPDEAEATAVFVVEGGKIILWDQIGSQIALAH